MTSNDPYITPGGKLLSSEFRPKNNVPYDPDHMARTLFTVDGDDRPDTEGSDITAFYEGRCLLVTGATGFVGKIVIEKLLRTCPNIESIFVLVRDKKGKDLHSRLEEVFSDPLYSKLALQQPKFRHKIVAIKGDVGLPDLGISTSDRELITSKVSVIFHGAATVRFDEKLKLAVHINVRGTKEMLQLARECRNLVSYVHISTAFSYCYRQEIDETFYKPPFTTTEILNIVNSTPEDILDNITLRLIGKFPNSYAFTKAIAEDTVREYGKGIPKCIVRPSIIVSTYREPLRGWIDNVYGPTGVVVGSGTGLMHSLHCDPNADAELIPVDIVGNAIIVAGYNCSKNGNDSPIYNVVSSVEAPLTWQEMMDSNIKYGLNFPAVKSVWYCSFTLNKYKSIHLLYVFFLHLIPALLVDAVTSVTRTTDISMLKVYKKIHKFSDVITYFANRRWKFTNHNVQNMWTELSDTDKRLFPFSMKDCDWDIHAQANPLGVRVYLVKDPIDTLPEARKKWRRLKYLHFGLKYVFLAILVRIVYGIVCRLFL